MLIHLSLLLLFLGLSHSDTFTSIKDMENLFDLEQNLVKAMDNYLKHAVFETEIMELHYKELSKIESEIQDIDEYVENPINAYSAIKRMLYDWPVIFKLMSSSPFFDEEPKYPDKSLLTEAIAYIIDWQTKKKLETSKLARGLYEGIMPHANLTASDCLEIAKYSYREDKRLAAQWLQEALVKVGEGGDSAHLLVHILEYTFLAKCLTDDLEGSVSAFQSLIMDGAIWYTPSAQLKNDYELDKVKKCEAAAKKSLKKKKEKSSVFKRYNWSTELCHSVRRSTNAGAGVCLVIIHWPTARFIKFEALEDIQIIHDFLPDNLIFDIKQSAIGKFKTLTSKGLNGPVPLSNLELAAVIDKRIGFMLRTSLKMLAADQQVYIHGPGGQHASLKSYLQQVPAKRIGTFYYFMTDVARGGNIVFPDHKVSIEPRKGTLVFWMDIEKEIEVKECPVVVGSKWAMTQSIVDEED